MEKAHPLATKGSGLTHHAGGSVFYHWILEFKQSSLHLITQVLRGGFVGASLHPSLYQQALVLSPSRVMSKLVGLGTSPRVPADYIGNSGTEYHGARFPHRY